LTRVLKPGGHFSFCDLGKPDSQVEGLLIGYYLRVLPNVIAAVTTGRLGFQYGSIFDTYILALRNSDLAALLSKYFARVELTETQFGGSIVVDCVV
jgi:ubiquinone/menaquinone biosynthesis C-methylase UbiE